MYTLDETTQKWIIDSYQSGMSACKIGKTIGKGHHFVQRIVVAAGLKLRPKRESHKTSFPAYATDKVFNDKTVWATPDNRLFYYTPCCSLNRDIRIPLIEVSCSCCGKKCLVAKHSKKPKRRFCSSDCHYKLQRGEYNSRWSGGKKKKTSGHILIYCPDHPNAKKGYVHEHRWVIENHIGRLLTFEEKVHHINAVKDDNRVENLCICTASEHNKIHSSIFPLLDSLLKSGLIEFDRDRKIYQLSKEYMQWNK